MSKEKRRVPKLRFPGFTEDWEQRKLGDVTNIKTGSRNQQDSVTNGQYPFFIRSEKIEKLDRYDFDTEAILVPGDGRIGEIFHYYNGKFALHQRVYKVDNFKGVDAFFLLYLFQCSFKEHALRLNAQGTVPSLRLPMFTEWNICIPSLQEQIGIGRLLNKIELMITLHQRKLDNLKLKKKALLQKLFPKNGERYPELRFSGFTDAWEQRKLGEFVKIVSGDAPSTFISGNCIYVKVDDLNYSDRIQLSSSNLVNANPKAHLVNQGATIFPKRGVAIMTNKVRIMGKDGYLDTNMMALIPEEIDKDFLFTFIQKTGLYKIADTSTIPQINNKHIEPYMIQVPSEKEQAYIGVIFKKIDKIITLHQRKLDHLKLQKKALLQQMFV